MTDCGCGGSRQERRRADPGMDADEPARREGGPQDRGSGYYSGPRRPPHLRPAAEPQEAPPPAPAPTAPARRTPKKKS